MRISRHRKAAILVCVLVVLLLVGMMLLQTTQTLMVARHSASSARNLRQAQELIEYGRAILSASHEESAAEQEAELPGELIVQVDQNTSGRISWVRPQDVPESDGSQRSMVRIEVYYPIESDYGVSASWEGMK